MTIETEVRIAPLTMQVRMNVFMSTVPFSCRLLLRSALSTTTLSAAAPSLSAPLALRVSERCFKGLLELLDVREITLRIDKWIWIAGPTFLQLRVLFSKAIEGRVRTHPNFRW